MTSCEMQSHDGTKSMSHDGVCLSGDGELREMKIVERRSLKARLLLALGTGRSFELPRSSRDKVEVGAHTVTDTFVGSAVRKAMLEAQSAKAYALTEWERRSRVF